MSGIDPGFSGDVLPLAALQLSDQVEEIRVQEICDYSSYADPEFTGMAFGFGKPASETPLLSLPGMLAGGWGGMVRMIAKALDVEIDELREVYERDYAKSDFECRMMKVARRHLQRRALRGAGHRQRQAADRHRARQSPR